jgi:hypothetical protein
MAILIGGNVHAGLSGLELEEETFDLGEGVILTKTYAHLTAPFLMAFKPAPPGGHHPAPWKAASGGFSFDLNVELLIPENIEEKFISKIAVCRTIVFLLRLGVHPGITLPVFSNHPFASLAEVRDKEARLVPFEVQPRRFPLEANGGRSVTEAVSWVKDRWQVAHRLISASPEFSLAVEAIDTGQFVQNTSLTMVLLWSALEALFSPSTSELKFRVSSLVAAFLEPPGEARHSLQKKIARLYDKRSAAAHGKPKHEAEDLVETFNLLACVLMEIIDRGDLPKKEELEELLFGSTLKANS